MRYRNRCKIIFWFCIAAVLMTIFYQCNPRYAYPVEPYLEFRTLTQTASWQLGDELLLTLYFTDGDGDIGQANRPNETAENLKIDLYLKDSGAWKHIDTLPSFGAWLEPLVVSGEESISGCIEQKLYVKELRNLQLSSDTIRFECWLIDNKKHESNRVTTSEYVIAKR